MNEQTGAVLIYGLTEIREILRKLFATYYMSWEWAEALDQERGLALITVKVAGEESVYILTLESAAYGIARSEHFYDIANGIVEKLRLT